MSKRGKGKGTGSTTETVLKTETYKARQEDYPYRESFRTLITEENYANVSATNRRFIHMNEETLKKGYTKDTKFKVPPNARNKKGLISLGQARNFYIRNFESKLIPRGGEKLVPEIKPIENYGEERKNLSGILDKYENPEEDPEKMEGDQYILINGYMDDIQSYLGQRVDEEDPEEFKDLLKDLLRVVKGKQPYDVRSIIVEKDEYELKELSIEDRDRILNRANGLINSHLREQEQYQFRNGKLSILTENPVISIVNQLVGTLSNVASNDAEREYFKQSLLDLIDYIQYEQEEDVALTLNDIGNVIEGNPSNYDENIQGIKVGNVAKKNIKDSLERIQKASGIGAMNDRQRKRFYEVNKDIIENPTEEKIPEPVIKEEKKEEIPVIVKKELDINKEVQTYLDTQNIVSSIDKDEDQFEVYGRITQELERRKNIEQKENILLDKKMDDGRGVGFGVEGLDPTAKKPQKDKLNPEDYSIAYPKAKQMEPEPTEPEPTEKTPLLSTVGNIATAVAPTLAGMAVGSITENPVLGAMASSAVGSMLDSDNATIIGSEVSSVGGLSGNTESTLSSVQSGITGVSSISPETIRSVLTQSVDGGALLIPPATESVSGSAMTPASGTEAPKDMPKGAFYPNPIHKYALSVFFGSATSPAWDMELFRGLSQDTDYQDIGAKKAELLMYSRMIVGKFGVDILVPFLRYSDSATPEQVLQENHEIMQLYMSKLNNRKSANTMSTDKTVNMKLKDLQEFRNLLENGAYTEASMTTEDLTPKQEGSLQMLQNGAGYEGQNAPNMQLRTTEQKQKFADPKILNALTPTEQRWMTPGAIPMKNRKFIGNEGKNVMLFPEQSKDLSKRVIMGETPKNVFLQRSKTINSTSEKIQTAPVSMKKSKVGSMDCYSMKNF